MPSSRTYKQAIQIAERNLALVGQYAGEISRIEEQVDPLGTQLQLLSEDIRISIQDRLKAVPETERPAKEITWQHFQQEVIHLRERFSNFKLSAQQLRTSLLNLQEKRATLERVLGPFERQRAQIKSIVTHTKDMLGQLAQVKEGEKTVKDEAGTTIALESIFGELSTNLQQLSGLAEQANSQSQEVDELTTLMQHTITEIDHSLHQIQDIGDSLNTEIGRIGDELEDFLDNLPEAAEPIPTEDVSDLVTAIDQEKSILIGIFDKCLRVVETTGSAIASPGWADVSDDDKEPIAQQFVADLRAEIPDMGIAKTAVESALQTILTTRSRLQELGKTTAVSKLDAFVSSEEDVLGRLRGFEAIISTLAVSVENAIGHEHWEEVQNQVNLIRTEAKKIRGYINALSLSPRDLE